MKKWVAILITLGLLCMNSCGRVDISNIMNGNAGQDMSLAQGNDNGSKTNSGLKGDDGFKTNNQPEDSGSRDSESQGANGSNASASASIPTSGVYWATYTVPGPNPNLEQQYGIKGPFYVSMLEFGELSTEELVWGFQFREGVNCMTDIDNRSHAQYWVERVQREDGQTVSLKLASTAANDFYMYLTVCPVTSMFPAYTVNIKSDDGVHAPDGSILSDPYKDPENPITGGKDLNFKCGTYRQGSEIKNIVMEAGYPAYQPKYQDGIFSFSTLKELDGRAKIEETVLKPHHWKPVESGTKGNVGLYSHSDSYTGKIAFNWSFSEVPFTVEMNDARLVLSAEGDDMVADDVEIYTLTGTAEIEPKAFTLEGVAFKLDDDKRKSYTGEDAFLIQKTPEPAVNWGFMGSWRYVSSYGTPWMLSVDFKTSKSIRDVYFVPVTDTDNIDGTFNMNFMMPAYGGTATWDFEPEYD